MLPRRVISLVSWCLLGIVSVHGFDLDEFSPRRLAVSTDGKRIALASDDNRVRVWDTQSGQLLHSLALDLPGTAVAFSPDGATLIAGTCGTRKEVSQPTRGHLYAWSLTEKEAKLRWKIPIVGRTMAIGVEPQGKWFAANTVYATLGIYRMEDGKLLHHWQEQGNSPSDLVISPDGKTIVTAGQALIMWDATKDKLPDEVVDAEKPLAAEASIRFMRARTAGSIATVFSADGTWVVAVGYFANAKGRPVDIAQLDTATGKIKSMIAKDVDGITCIALAPSSKTLAVGLNSGSILVIDVESKRQIARWKNEGQHRVRSLLYFNEGRKLAVASEGGQTLHIYDADTGRRLKRLWPAD